MPSTKTLVICASVGLIGWIVYASMTGGGDEDDLAALAQRDRQRKQNRAVAKSKVDPEAAFEALAVAGKGQAVPEDFIVSPDPAGFWIIGKSDEDFGVKIPFSPGQTAKPAPTLDPVHSNPGFLGAQACKECHAKTYESFVQTSHFRTSHLATPESITGNLTPGSNRLNTASPNVHFTMLQRDGQAYQRVNFFDWQFEVPMHIVTGSSKLAQTYLYWHKEGLYQANVTYLSSHDRWINSPGFLDGDAAYERPIIAVCLECHTTYADFREGPNKFTPDSLILGISCERCHGPGRDHVKYHTENPDAKDSKFLVVPSDLPREKEMQVCSQCHTGVNTLKGQPYQFRPGDDITDHYELADTKSGNSVHTNNQLERLEKSECYIQSKMTCVDCHNPHQFERANFALFSQRCIKCHESQSCGISEQLGERIAENCIDCHMPNGGSKNLRFDTAIGSIFPELRDHYIRIDEKASQEFLKSNSK